MEDVSVLFAALRNDVRIPSKRDEDAGYDIYASFDEDYKIISPEETAMIPTGLISAFPSGYVMVLKERGSTGTKGIGQRSGVIDSGYRGEWIVPITNHNYRPIMIVKEGALKKDTTPNPSHYIIYPYEKAICQAILLQVPNHTVKHVTVDEVLAIGSARMDGKFGSSGK